MMLNIKYTKHITFVLLRELNGSLKNYYILQVKPTNEYKYVHNSSAGISNTFESIQDSQSPREPSETKQLHKTSHILQLVLFLTSTYHLPSHFEVKKFCYTSLYTVSIDSKILFYLKGV